MNENTEHKKDIAIIGTGPSSLIQSIILSANDQRVTIIDSSPKIGGAWHTIDFFDLKEIECGPHFFHTEPDIDLFEMMGVDTMKTPPPEWHIKIHTLSFKTNEKLGKLLAYSYGLIINLIKLTKKILFPSKRDLKVYFIFKHLLPILTSKTSTRYFSNGSADFITTLESLAKKNGVIIKKERLESVQINTNKKTTTLQTSEASYDVNHLYLTDRSAFDQLIVNGKSRRLVIDKIYRVQVHFIIESKEKINFFVHKFLNYGYFAVTNLSFIYNKAHLKIPENQTLITATVTKLKKDEKVTKSTINEIISDLQDRDILPKDSRLIRYDSSLYPDFRLSSADVKELENRPEISFIGDIDLVQALNLFKNDFKKILNISS